MMMCGDLTLRECSGRHTHESVFPNRYIVQQCTGKYSINEDLIYEGDIVGIQMKDPNKMYRAIVKYGDCQFYFEPINENEWIEDWNLIDDSCRFEIIGNIMEDNNET
jgi:hypothetical protein